MLKKILVLDDAQGNLEPLRIGLERSGYSLIAPRDTQSPAAAFSEQQPELVVIHLDAPAALETCVAIRDDIDGAIVPILLIGEHPDITSPSDALSQGADYHFSGAQPVERILAKVQTYIGPGSPPATAARDQGPTAAGGSSQQQAAPAVPELASPEPLGATADALLQRMEANPPPSPSAPSLPETAARETAGAHVSAPAGLPSAARAASATASDAGDGQGGSPASQPASDGVCGEAAAAKAPRHAPMRQPEEPPDRERSADRPAANPPPQATAPEPTASSSSGSTASGAGSLQPARGQIAAREDAAAVLARAWWQRASGCIRFRHDEHQKRLYLERGAIVHAQSTQPYDRIEGFLYREGKITRAQYQQVRVKQLETPRRIGTFLLEEGYLKPEELFTAVRGHLEEVVYGAFEWESGEYSWASERAAEDERVTLDKPTPALIVEGIRRKHLLPRLMQRVGGPNTLLGPTEAPVGDLDALALTADERHVVRLLDGTRNVEDLVFSTGLEAPRVYQVLAALLSLGHAEVLVPGITTVDSDGTASHDRIDRTRIQEKLQQIRECDYFEILGVAPAATAYEIQRAYDRNRHEFSPQRFSTAIRESMGSALDEIERVLDDAWEVLRNETTRQAYARHLP